MNNFAVRTISSVVYVALMLAGLLVHPALFACLFLFIMLAAMNEFYVMALGKNGFKTIKGIAYVSATALFLLVFFYAGYGLAPKFIPLAIIPMIAMYSASLFLEDKSEYFKLSQILAGFVYIVIPVSLASLVVFRGGEFNGVVILCLFIIIWAADVGAYCVGTAFGQKPDSKKLCPSISPKKSWVGVWGGIAVSVLATFLSVLVGLLDIPYIHCVPLGILVCVSSVFGDLFESQWKRHYGIKDSGNIIPGHGGMLDRMDSALFAIPVGTIYLAIFNLI